MTTRPVLLAVDDEPEVLQAIELDLRREYGASYRILRTTSGSEALEILKKIKLRNEPVAHLRAVLHN
jgi:thioredoxin reductase (NADPH)